MTKYRLLKDLPFAKAGEIFKSKILDDGEEYLFWGEVKTEKIENFDEWFEEIKEPEFFYYIDEKGLIIEMRTDYRHADIHLRKAIGNYFETEEEVKKHLERLKARAVIMEDAKEFKPDWNDKDEWKYYGVWNADIKRLDWLPSKVIKHDSIYFKTADDIRYSLEAHQEEWKIYLGIE